VTRADISVDNPAALSVSTRPYNFDVSSDASFEMAKKWIVDCMDRHYFCRLYMRGTLPSRVLDIDDKEGIVRLREKHCHESPSSANYVSLSYCWGKDQPEKTTTANISKYKDGILIPELPQTIQDAIRVTQSLGIRFLWVDSLCIVQDDPLDMAKELSLIPDYYENSLVTICAARTSSCVQGFLQPRKTAEYLTGPFALQYYCPSGSVGSVQLVQHRSFSPLEEVINSRGWTLQESLLSTRLLSYGTRGLRWSCLEETWSRGGPCSAKYELDMRLVWTDWRLKHYSSRIIRNEFDKFHTKEASMECWKLLVEDYTQRRLTNPSDKLSALSGAAQRYQDSLSRQKESTQYLAGLWLSDIIRQLLWMPAQNTGSFIVPDRRLSSPRRLEEFQAPSWSWASLDGAIEYPCWNFAPPEQDKRVAATQVLPRYSPAEVVHFEIEPVLCEAPLSTLKSALLFIHGKLFCHIVNWEELELTADTEQDRRYMELAIASDNLVLLELINTELMKGKWQEGSRGLILLEDDKGRGLYRRIGTFCLRRPYEPNKYFDASKYQTIGLI
jgi:hypothetical protein